MTIIDCGRVRAVISFFTTLHKLLQDQPCHLKLKDASVLVKVNLELYDDPERCYCRAGVYEIVRDAIGENPRLQTSAQNCIHWKACDIEDPTQDIVWAAREGDGGPNYPNM